MMPTMLALLNDGRIWVYDACATPRGITQDYLVVGA